VKFGWGGWRDEMFGLCQVDQTGRDGSRYGSGVVGCLVAVDGRLFVSEREGVVQSLVVDRLVDRCGTLCCWAAVHRVHT